MPEKREATIRYLPKDETTFYMDEMEERERWQYYVSSWTRLEPTEGVDRSRVKHSVLVRNIPSDTEEQPRPRLAYSEGMVVAICLNSSKVFFESGTSEYFIYKTPPASEEAQKRRETVQKIEKEVRDQKFEEKADTKNLLMKDLTAEQVKEENEELEKLLGNSQGSAPEPAAPQAVAAAA
jgi:paired amphipathic helix protein Sin3a